MNTMQPESIIFAPGDYVRVYIPGRQKLVPCQLEERTENQLWQCRPLKKCSIHRYIVPTVQIIGKINPKEINLPCSPSTSPAN